MGKKHVRNWFRALGEKESQGNMSLPKSNSDCSIGGATREKVVALSRTVRPPSPKVMVIEDQSFIGKRKGGQQTDKTGVAKKAKDV